MGVGLGGTMIIHLMTLQEHLGFGRLTGCILVAPMLILGPALKDPYNEYFSATSGIQHFDLNSYSPKNAEFQQKLLSGRKEVPAITPDFLNMKRREIDTVMNRLNEFDVPVLIQHCENDQWNDPLGSTILFNKISSTDKKLNFYDGSGTPVYYDDKIGKIAIRDMVEWVSDHIVKYSSASKA
jgi:esterase/lipase